MIIISRAMPMKLMSRGFSRAADQLKFGAVRERPWRPPRRLKPTPAGAGITADFNGTVRQPGLEPFCDSRSCENVVDKDTVD
jgi:hypothetical protein